MSPTVKDFLGFVVNPPPGDASRTAGSDQLGSSVALVGLGSAGALPGIYLPPPSGDTSGVTDGAAITAALIGLPASGGMLIFGKGAYYDNQQRNFDNSTSVVLAGQGGSSGGAVAGSALIYTGTAAPYISAQTSFGLRVTGLQVIYNNAGFVGRLIDLSAGKSATFENCRLDGASITSAAGLVLLTNCVGVVFRGVGFSWAQAAVEGSSNGNVVNFYACGFDNFVNAPVSNPGESWNLIGCKFEPLTNGNCGAVTAALAKALNLIGCWMGDGNALGTWVSFVGNALSVIGCRFGNGAAAISFSGGSQTLLVTGCHFDTITTAVAIVGGGDISMSGNRYTAVTNRYTLSGTPAGSILTGPTGAGLVFTGNMGFYNQTPTAQPQSAGAAAGYTAGATVATFHSDDTYTGNLGSTAYTVNGIVLALKQLGLIKT